MLLVVSHKIRRKRRERRRRERRRRKISVAQRCVKPREQKEKGLPLTAAL